MPCRKLSRPAPRWLPRNRRTQRVRGALCDRGRDDCPLSRRRKTASPTHGRERSRVPRPAHAVRRTRERWTPRERDLFGHLEQSVWFPDRTRASESRRIQEEAPAKERALSALKELGEGRAAPENERADGPERSDKPRTWISRGLHGPDGHQGLGVRVAPRSPDPGQMGGVHACRYLHDSSRGRRNG